VNKTSGTENLSLATFIAYIYGPLELVLIYSCSVGG